MSNKIRLTAFSLIFLSWISAGSSEAKDTKSIEETQDEKRIDPKLRMSASHSSAREDSLQKKDFPSARSLNDPSNTVKSITWTSLPTPPRIKKVQIGEQERWVDVGTVPSLQEVRENLSASKDLRKGSVGARPAYNKIVKSSFSNSKADGKKSSRVEKPRFVELASYGNEEARLTPEEIKKLISDAKKLNK